jgi:hypothetical protein
MRRGEDFMAIEGNYSILRDLIWAAADTLVWLDYSLALVFGRLLRRTIRRTLAHEMLWGRPEYAHLQVVRLRTPAQTAAWLSGVRASPRGHWRITSTRKPSPLTGSSLES